MDEENILRWYPEELFLYDMNLTGSILLPVYVCDTDAVIDTLTDDDAAKADHRKAEQCDK